MVPNRPLCSLCSKITVFMQRPCVEITLGHWRVGLAGFRTPPFRLGSCAAWWIGSALKAHEDTPDKPSPGRINKTLIPQQNGWRIHTHLSVFSLLSRITCCTAAKHCWSLSSAWSGIKTQSDLKQALVSKQLGLKNMHKKKKRDFKSELEERIRVVGSGINIQKRKDQG